MIRYRSMAKRLIRWWFTMADDTLIKDADDCTFEIHGNSVKVLSENELLDQNGQRIHTGAADDATSGFAADFTWHLWSSVGKAPCPCQSQKCF